MAGPVTTQLIGFDEVRQKLQVHAEKIEREVEAIPEEAAAEAKHVADTLCPVRTGYLRSRNKTEKQAEGVWVLKNDAPYALFVIFGTRYMNARDFFTPAYYAGRRYLMARLRALHVKVG